MNSQFRILIVDDTPKNIQVVASLLKPRNYRIAYATSGEQALTILQENTYDLVLMDVMMPGINGYETCRRLKKIDGHQETPVIFLTARSDHDSIVEGFESGGQDYVTKPFNVAELLARVNTHLKLKAFENSQQRKIDEAVAELKKLNKELEETQKEVVFTMGAIAETRSKETGSHVRRVAEYSKLLALLSGVSQHEAEIIKLASPMHDIGKVGIPDSILNKNGALSASERQIMNTHATLGFEMLKHSRKQIMQTAAIIALEHHERWDGSGYPNGKKGGDIHLYGRITALADVFDALCSKRCYKEAWQEEDIYQYLRTNRASQFDPQLIDLFFDNLQQFLEIRQNFSDPIVVDAKTETESQSKINIA